MISFYEQEHDCLATTYIGVNKNYRWWVCVPHERPTHLELQIHRIVNEQGVPRVGERLFSNLPESRPIDDIDKRVRNKIAKLSIDHHLRHGKKNAFQEYKNPHRNRSSYSRLYSDHSGGAHQASFRGRTM